MPINNSKNYQSMHEIVKYSPLFYDANGVFHKNEWTSCSEIGKSFDGKKLTTEEYFTTENNYIKCLNRDVVYNKVIASKLKTDLDWLEWQANYFGASILMPRRLIKQYYLDNCNSKDIKQMSREISEICGVSKQAAEIRIRDTNDDKSLKNQMVMEGIN